MMGIKGANNPGARGRRKSAVRGIGAGREPAPRGRTSARAGIAEAFVRRYTHLIERIAESAPERALTEALGAPSDIGGLASILEEVAEATPPAQDPLARARLRAVEAKRRLLERAGGAYSVGELAKRLDLTPQAIHGWRTRGTVLAVEQPGGYVYPACQFGAEGRLKGLDEVLRAFDVADPWVRLNVLLAPDDALAGRSPIEVLREGDVEGAVGSVRRYGQQGL